MSSICIVSLVIVAGASGSELHAALQLVTMLMIQWACCQAHTEGLEITVHELLSCPTAAEPQQYQVSVNSTSVRNAVLHNERSTLSAERHLSTTACEPFTVAKLHTSQGCDTPSTRMIINHSV
jgi:hypothetical protein